MADQSPEPTKSGRPAPHQAGAAKPGAARRRLRGPSRPGADPARDTNPPVAGGRARVRGAVLLVAAVTLVLASIPSFRVLKEPDPIMPGEGVTELRHLSDYLPAIAGTPGDTEVYVLDSGVPGGTAVVLGGTHADEIAGVLAAVLLVERAVPTQGRLLVIPRANASGATHSLPMEGYPQFVRFATADGGWRSFRYGSRLTNPLHQWPDPIVYVHAASGQRLSGSDTRNLNRAYPGRPDGTLTEQIAYAITQLVLQEQADLVVDLHEASPEYPVINTIVAHPRAMELAAWVGLSLQSEGIEIGLEPSPESLRGLIHRELGESTPALVVLMETANPAQGRLRGRTDERLVVEGTDAQYVKAAEIGRLFVPFDEGGHPLSVRVARHLTALQAFFANLGLFREGRGIAVEGLARYEELAGGDLGRFLRSR